MVPLKESGEAWIAAGQAEYGQMLIETHDTIERQANEIELLKKENGKAWLGRQNVIADRQKARKERDAALAENKKLNGIISGLSAQSQDEIDRLTVTANSNAAAHAKACQDLAAARAGVERLKPATVDAFSEDE